MGQTIIENPQELFPKVIAEIQEKVADKATQERLFVLIVALIPNQEMLKMFEDLPTDILLESPFLRRIRAESAQDALDQGRREGAQEAQRHSLLLLLERQFGNMPFQFVTQIGQLKLEQLNQLFSLALEAKSFEEVEQALN